MTATGRDVDLSGVDIGTVVKVKGGVGSFREVRQMLLERICRSDEFSPPFSFLLLSSLATRPTGNGLNSYEAIIRTTNEEVTAWAENTAFRKEVLDTAWVVGEEEEKRARRKAEGLDRERQRRRRKRREEEERKAKGKSAGAGKEKRRGKDEGHGRRDGDVGPSKRQAGDEDRDRRREVDKARKSNV